MTLMLETLRGDQTLDAGGLGVGFLAFALGLDFTADDEFADLRESQKIVWSDNRSMTWPLGEGHGIGRGKGQSTHIIFTRQIEKLANLGRPLRPQPLRLHTIRQPGNLPFALLNDTERQHRQICRNNTPSNTLPPPLAGPSGPVTAVSCREQQPHASRVHDALLHGETLFVVAAGDLEDVAGELGAERVGGDFLAHAAVHEDAQFAVILDLDEFLGAVGRVGYVEFHLDGGVVKMMGGVDEREMLLVLFGFGWFCVKWKFALMCVGASEGDSRLDLEESWREAPCKSWQHETSAIEHLLRPRCAHVRSGSQCALTAPSCLVGAIATQ